MRKHCLVIDDQAMVRRFICAVLTSSDVPTFEAADATEALALLENKSEDVGAIICDVNMPGFMSGFEFGAHVRRKFPTMPILIISGYSDSDEQSEFDYMEKPFTSKKLLDWVQQKMATDKTVGAG